LKLILDFNLKTCDNGLTKSGQTNQKREIMMNATETQIRQKIAESGKTTVTQIMSYLKTQMRQPYDVKIARANAKELVAEMKGYM
jgi:UDP-galactopyranose mutase